MKYFVLPIFFSLLIYPDVFSQAPEVEWDNTIGGFGYDRLTSVTQTTSDGGYIVCGHSESYISGDKTEANIGGSDFWIIRLDADGNILWQNTIGGSGNDGVYLPYSNIVIKPTADGGYILGGMSNSNISGDKTENNLGGYYDYWILKLDAFGNISWQNTIGGANDDILVDLSQTSDGGYIIGGHSGSSLSFDKTEYNLGGYDYWIIKLDSVGNIMWQNTIGGGDVDALHNIRQTLDGGYIIAGHSDSDISGDKTETHLGFSDYWIVKLDSLGNITWQNDLGGIGLEADAKVVQCPDGNYIVAGYSSSDISGDKTESYIGIGPNNYDFWVLKLDSVGKIIWQNTIGTEAYEYFGSIEATPDNGCIFGGSAYGGISGDKTEPCLGNNDFWIIRLDANGNIVWQNTIGGWDNDALADIKLATDGGYILGGYSNSLASFDKSENYVGPYTNNDYWVVKLEPECTYYTFYRDADDDGFGRIDSTISLCDTIPPAGYVTDNTDCIDTNGLVFPGAAELCNAMDDNCDGLIDEGLLMLTYYLDYDSDGFGNDTVFITTCNLIPPAGYVADATDCNDNNNLLHEPTLYFADADGDLFGDYFISDLFCSLVAPPGYATNNLDCDDGNILVNPVTNEVCNSVDDNCNILIDEDIPVQTLFIDVDGDLYGDELIDSITCMLELFGYVSNNLDCDDNDSLVYPGAPEIFNGIDDNCNKLIDEGVDVEGLFLDNIKIYPNPVNDILFIETENNIYPFVEIINLAADIIYSAKLSSLFTAINMSDYPAGIYAVQIKTNTGIITKKIVKI
ncbi:MAG: MopE-related protein [Chitinophagales bacterium]